MRLVFLGPPGAGKGTQAARLAEELGIPHISTGEILRTAIMRSTATGLEAKSFVDAGEFVPFEIVLRLVEDRLQEEDAQSGWLLDGFPRNLQQAHALEGLLDNLEQSLDRVVYFEVDDDEVVRRLSGRRMCKTCNNTFHLEFSPPPDPSECAPNECEIFQRSDDSEESIRNRLKVYSRETDPLVGHYRQSDALLAVSGSGGIDEIQSSVRRALGCSR